MKLAELGIDVDLMSLTPVKRSHSVCAQGGINSVNDLTRQQGDNEWLHFDDTVYGGDFLQHQPPVKEMVDWGPQIIDLMDRLGVPFNRTPEGFRDQRRFGGTLFKRTAFAGATTGQQLALRARRASPPLGSRRQSHEVRILGFSWPDARRQRRLPRLRRPRPGDDGDSRLPGRCRRRSRSGGCGLIYGRSTMSMACTGSAVSRAFQAGAKYGNAEFIQVHPTAVPGADKLRLMSESARGEGGRVWVPRKPQDPRDPQADSGERALLLPRRAVSEVRQPRAARHRHPRNFQRLHARRA